MTPLIADNTVERPDSALETPWKRLRIRDDVKMGEGFVAGDADRLMCLR